MRCGPLVVALLLAGSGAVAAQDASPLIATDREANAQLLQIIETTRAQGLPVEPILSKVRYAVNAVHASPARILATAQAIAARLPIARDALAPRDTPADIAAAETALSYAVPKEAVAAVRKASSEPSVAIPLGTLTQLVASGVKVKQASEIVLSLIRRGATTQQLASFIDNVNADLLVGGHPDDVSMVRMKLLSAALAPPAAGAPSAGLTSSASGPRKP